MFHQLQKLLPRKRVFTVNRTVERNRNLEHLSFNCCSSFHCTVKSLTREPRCILMAGPAFVALGPLIGNDIRAAVIHSRFRLPRRCLVARISLASLRGLPLSQKPSLLGSPCIIASLILLDKYTVSWPRILNRPPRTRQLYNSSKTV